MSDNEPGDRAEQISARVAAATVGPWRWSNTGGSVYLQGARSRIVMAFRRMGMTGAQPQMIREPHGRLILDDLGRENINEYPDADLIANAPADLAWLLQRVANLEAELAVSK